MKSWNKPTPEQVERAIALLVYAEQCRHFFDRLDNPEWLEPLRNKKFFSHPPAPVRNEKDGTVCFPPWPEARYLARMAERKPVLVARIVREMPDTDNATVQSDLIEATLAMPPDVSAELVEKVETWAESPYLLFPEKLGELMAHLATGDRNNEALRIARILLDVLLDEQRARFDTWHYKQILKNHYPELSQAVGLPALDLLCDFLEKAIRLSQRREENEGPEDYSYIWRPAIEDHAQNLSHTVKDALVPGVRDTAEVLIRSGKSQLRDVIETLEKQRYNVFRRLVLHVLRVFADQAEQLIRGRLTDRSLFEGSHVQHEYVLLLQVCFVRLPEEGQRTILGWIEAGPDVGWFKKWREGETGSPPSEEEITHYRETWQRDRLAWIPTEALSEIWRKRYRTLVEKYDEPNHPDFASYTEGGWVGPSSPKTKEEIESMSSVEDVVTFLKTWKPHHTELGEPSPEGLGRALSGLVAETPARFASEAEKLQGIDPTYVRSLLSGLRDSLKQQKTFDWCPVLALCQWVVEQLREIPGRRVERFDADPDWGGTRRAIADLLSIGFDAEAGEIPIELRKRVWAVLRPLTDDPDPTPEHEEEYGGSNMDPATLSINTVRGKAMHSVVRYALWIRRQFEKKGAQERLEHGLSETPEVREVLDTHLDIAREPSLAIRAVYGQWFPWLDPTWARENAGRIFPAGTREQVYFDAAWNTYITFCGPYDNVFEVLRDRYHHAVHRIGPREGKTRLLADPDKELSEHLMAFYWREKLPPDDPLLADFWEKAADDLRAHALSFVGRALESTSEPIPAEVLRRLKTLWEARLAAGKQAPANHEKEIAAFGWWFVSGKFDTRWVISQLGETLRIAQKVDPDYMVVEKLAEIAGEYPLEAMQCLKGIVEGDAESWSIYAQREQIRKILSLGLQNPGSRRQIESIVHYLGSRGFLEFRDLLS